MSTWTDPSTINTNPKDPITSEYGTASLENPVAMAEGASGAPKVQAAALETSVFGVDMATTADDEAFECTDGGVFLTFYYDIMVRLDAAPGGSDVIVLRYRESTDGGTTVGGFVTAASIDVSGNSVDDIIVAFGSVTLSVGTNYIQVGGNSTLASSGRAMIHVAGRAAPTPSPAP